MYESFCQLVHSYATGQSLDVAWPGIAFDPGDSLWLEVLWNQNGTNEYAMGLTDSAVEIGFFRVLVNVRPGAGVVQSETVARDLVAAIPKGTPLGEAFVTRQPEITGPVTDPENRIVMTTITWRYQTH